jgi:hypothetical protein
MAMMIWVCDRVLILGGLPENLDWSRDFSFPFLSSLLLNSSTAAVHSVEFVHSSLHRPPRLVLSTASGSVVSGLGEGVVDEETRSPNPSTL